MWPAGWTAFMHATAHHPQLELARILLEFGADACAINRWGRCGRALALGAMLGCENSRPGCEHLVEEAERTSGFGGGGFPAFL